MYKLITLIASLMLSSTTLLATQSSGPLMPSIAELEKIQPGDKTDKRFLFLDGVISDQTISPLKAALEDIIQSNDKGPVRILINSPGGEVIAGMSFINRMQAIKAKGIDIDCYVLDFAASMAFQIFTQCSHRYALSSSFLLWHGIRISTNGAITAAYAASVAEDLHRTDLLIISQLRSSLQLSDEEIMYHFSNETFWSGHSLKSADPEFLNIMVAYPDLLSNLGTAVKVAMPELMFNKSEQLIYIWDGYKKH